LADGKLVASSAVLLALSSSQKLALALVAAAFVTFALVSAMVIPRRRPDYPAPRLFWFIGATVLLTVAMLSTVAFVAKEEKEEAEAVTQAETTVAEADPAAGEKLYEEQGCGSCHTFQPAGSTGTAGPDLANLAADAKKAKAESVEEYAFDSIDDPNGYVVPGFQPNVMPDFGLEEQQIRDLVAFLTQSS
jgi:mono/diheme cytochrome c family protein